MLASTHLPVVFLACVNSYRNGKRLRYLVKERKALASILESRTPGFFQPVQKGNISNEFYLNLLDQFHYHQRITHLHLVGHANGNMLRLESDTKEVEMTPKELAELIDKLPYLKCIYLDGCATPELLEVLLRKDIPAIIATQTFERDREAATIAQAFYQGLSVGCSLREAFDRVKKSHPGMQAYRVEYEIETDEMNWFAKEDMEDELPWGMYFLKDHADRLLEEPADRPMIPYEEDSPRTRAGNRMRRAKLMAAAVVFGLLAASLAFTLNSHPDWYGLLAAW